MLYSEQGIIYTIGHVIHSDMYILIRSFLNYVIFRTMYYIRTHCLLKANLIPALFIEVDVPG
jgi:hypothetical protein